MADDVGCLPNVWATETNAPKVNAHRGIEQSRRDDIEAIGSLAEMR